MTEAQACSCSLEVPKRLQRTAKKLAAKGETPVLIAPAILQSQASSQMLAIARMGMLDKILGYLVTTTKNVHFIRPAWSGIRCRLCPWRRSMAWSTWTSFTATL